MRIKPYIYSAFLSIALLGCGSSDGSSDNKPISSETEELSANQQEESNEVVDGTPTPVAIVSNEIIFGSGDLKRETNLVDGEFSKVTYSDSVDDSIFKLSFSFESGDSTSAKTLIMRVADQKSSRVAILFLPNLEFSESGTINTSNIDELSMYGLKSSGTFITTTVKIDDASPIIFREDNLTTLDLSKATEIISEKLDYDMSMDSYLSSGSEVEITLAFTNTNSFPNGTEVSEKILDGFIGDIRSLIENRLTADSTMGFFGLVEIE
jgi:hypothetical protein